MKKMFDDHFEQAMQNDLISGNPAAVASWKEATDKYKDFARTWKSKDLVDRITQTRPGALDDGVELIVAPADAANYIFNVSNLGFSTKRELQRDILKMKKLLPESDFKNCLFAWSMQGGCQTMLCLVLNFDQALRR
jgi:hypothetical protein